jgi:endonuclease G
MKNFQNIVVIALLIIPTLCFGDYLIVGRSATLKTNPERDAQIIAHLKEGAILELLDVNKVSGYYHPRMPNSTQDGWIYQTLVRRYAGEPIDNGGSSSASFSTLSFANILPAMTAGDVIIAHDGYTSCLSTEFLVPKWVAHQVSDQLLQGNAKRERSTYPRDVSFPALKSNAYSLSGYDHGHLAPAGDFKRSRDLMDESFYMTNMSPQHGCMNQKGWCVLESNVRHWARQSPTSMFHIFSGAVLTEFIDSLCIDNATTIYVPSQFYKIVVEQTASGQVRGSGFLVANADVSFADLPGGRVSIDEIESMTGINFMPALSPAQETQVEHAIFSFDLQDLPECKGNKSCDGVYSSRTRPEDRTNLICK